MTENLGLIDFHAHLKGDTHICQSHIRPVPFVGNATELLHPVVAPVVHHAAHRWRGKASLMAYRAVSNLGFNAVLHLFEKHREAELLASMDRLGIERTVINVIEPYFKNDDVSRIMARYPDRFSLFAGVDPARIDAPEHLAAIIERGGVSGIKIHPALAGPDPTDERMFELVQVAWRYQLPVQVHTGSFPFEALRHDDDASLLRPVIREFPSVDFVLAHIGWNQHRSVLGLAQECPNVSVESSWQPAKIVRQAVDLLGPGRVLFGSDYPLMQQEPAVKVMQAALNEKERRLVTRENALRLLHLS